MLITGMITLLFFLLLTGLPLVFAIGSAALAYYFFADINLALLTQRMTSSIDSFLILAIPFFFLAGELMNACRLTDRIIALARVCVGHLHGGLAQVNILASLIFSGLSGSPTADTTALGSVLIPAMKREGYPAAFSAAITVASSMVGPMVPPSVALVIYGTLANVSVGRLLLAGIVPGLVIIATQMAFTWFYARSVDLPRCARATLPDFCGALSQGVAALCFPLIIISGILLGIFSPTEAAAVAVLYALCLGFFYKNVRFADIVDALSTATLGTARILAIIAVASAFSWIMVREGVPLALASAISSVSEQPVVVLFLIVVMLLGMGLLMVASSAEIVLTPILVPVIVQFGIDPVHFGILMVFVLIIGGATPPVGVLLFIAQDIARVSHVQMVRAMLPFYIPLAIAIVLLVCFPQISLFLPNLVFGP